MGHPIDAAQDPSLDEWLVSTQDDEPLEVIRRRSVPADRDPMVWLTALLFSASAAALVLAAVAAVIVL